MATIRSTLRNRANRLVRSPIRSCVQGGTLYESNLVISHDLIDSLTDLQGGSAATVTRADTGWYVDTADGLLKSASANNPRFQDNGILLEETTISKALHMDDMTDAVWTTSGIDTPVKETVIADPEGGFNAWRITSSTSAGAAYIAQVTAAADSNSGGLWVHEGNTDQCSWLLADGGTATGGGDINDIGIGWRRLTSGMSQTGDSVLVAVNLSGVLGTSTEGNYILVYNMGLQTTASYTSDLETTSASEVTRSDEKLLTDNDASMPAVENDFAISFYLTPTGDPGSAAVLMNFVGETGSRNLVWNTNGTLLHSYGGTTDVTTATIFEKNNPVHIMMTGLGSSNFQTYVNGIELLNDTIGTSSGTHTSVRFNNDSDADFVISNVRGYNRHFANSSEVISQMNAFRYF